MKSGLDNHRIEFNGVQLEPKDREAMAVILDHDGNRQDPVRRREAIGANYLMENCKLIDWRSQVSRVRSRLSEAGLIDVKVEPRTDPISDEKLMIPTGHAFEHADYVRWMPDDTLEDRVQRLEEIVENHIVVDPDGFQFDE